VTVLAIETSCDETSAAVVSEYKILSAIVSTQIKLHSEYGGVVPEIAVREHLKNLPIVVRAALKEAQINANQIDAVAATRGPGLPSALMAGYRTGQAMAYALDKPFIGIHHHEAHLYSPWISAAERRLELELFKPNVSLIVSGGHTLLVYVKKEFDHTVLGSTVDDAAGECFDKVAKLIGLPYPGGPQLDRLAEKGDPSRYNFPRPMLQNDNLNFSFSGLKTSVRYFLRDNPDALGDLKKICDLCAAVRAAIIDVLVAKTLRAVELTGVKCITASGGVSCNKLLRKTLEKVASERRLYLRLADPQFSTDNAAMVGTLAACKLIAGFPPTELDSDIIPSYELT
jgi:N6-L-threonylcarbamoyladenine synthase